MSCDTGTVCLCNGQATFDEARVTRTTSTETTFRVLAVYGPATRRTEHADG